MRRLRAGAAAVLVTVLLWAIAIYRALISPLLHSLTGSACRFQPTCSVYAAECVRLHGPFHGSARALGRLLRCHPFSRGGVVDHRGDFPVPPSTRKARRASPPPREDRADPPLRQPPRETSR